MEGSTLTRPRPGTDPDPAQPSPGERGDGLAKIVFALLCLGFAIGFFVFPTYPVYDSYYSLLWGRDLLHGNPLVFDGFRYRPSTRSQSAPARSCSSSGASGTACGWR